jgi:hypothetical protein
MRDLESKNPPDRPLLSAETGNVEISRQDPLERALFPIDDVSVVREDWMVVCAVMCEPVSFAETGKNTGKIGRFELEQTGIVQKA